MSYQQHIKKLIFNYNRRLQKLKERQALKGVNTPPEDLIEIEDIEAEIKRLEEKLETVRTSSSSLSSLPKQLQEEYIQIEILSILYEALKLDLSKRVPKNELLTQFNSPTTEGVIETLCRKGFVEQTSEKFGEQSFFYLEIIAPGIKFLEDEH